MRCEAGRGTIVINIATRERRSGRSGERVEGKLLYKMGRIAYGIIPEDGS